MTGSVPLAAAGLSSAARKLRPSAGATPSIENNSADATAPCKCSGSRGPLRLTSYQAIGSGKWQRLEHYGVYYAEDRCGCSDPQRQGRNSGGCEAGIPPEHPQAVANVLKQVIHGNSNSDVPNVFLDLFHSA